MKKLLIILLCLALAGCATGYQKTALPNNLSEEEKAERRGQFNAFVDELKVFMPEEKVLTLAKDLMKKKIITLEREVTVKGTKEMVNWQGSFHLDEYFSKNIILTFDNDKLVTWEY